MRTLAHELEAELAAMHTAGPPDVNQHDIGWIP